MGKPNALHDHLLLQRKYYKHNFSSRDWPPHLSSIVRPEEIQTGVNNTSAATE